jgi:hypothetical protein
VKTTTILLIAGGAAALYYLSKKKAADAATTTTQGVQSPPFVAPSVVAQVAQVTQVAPDSDADADYGSWGWSNPAFGQRAWRPGGGHGHSHGRGHR